jgi:hypothetical protein
VVGELQELETRRKRENHVKEISDTIRQKRKYELKYVKEEKLE